jgi:hypothetical protein
MSIFFIDQKILLITKILFYYLLYSEKYYLKVIPSEANEESEVPVRRPDGQSPASDGEESIELIKISSR